MGENGATVTLFDDMNNDGMLDAGDTTFAATTVSGGSFSTTIDLTTEGVHHISAVQTDSAGNVSGTAAGHL